DILIPIDLPWQANRWPQLREIGSRTTLPDYNPDSAIMQTRKSQPAYRLSILLLFFIMQGLNSFAQIVNIEAQRIVTDTTGWFGDVSGNFSLQENVNKIYAFSGQLHVENKSRSTKNLWLFLGNAGLLKVGSSNFANNALALGLYNRKLNNVI